MATQKFGKAVGGLALILLVVIAIWVGTRGVDSSASAPQPRAEPESPAEPQLPGEPFEASGTMGAFPGAPGLPINLWNTPDRSSLSIRVIGRLAPGQRVTITRRYQDREEPQLYYRVESGELVGWVPQTIVKVDG